MNRQARHAPSRLIVTFDTSAHNRLADDSSQDRFVEAINRQCFFRFAGVAIEEIYATKEESRRRHLLASCRKLQVDPTDCLYPQNEMLVRLIRAYSDNGGSGFDWTLVEVRSQEMSQELMTGELVGEDALLKEHRTEHFERLRQYKKMFADMRPILQPTFDAHGERRPRTFKAFLDHLEQSDQKLIAGFGKILYDKVAGTDVSRDIVTDMYKACPPFRAFNYSLLMSWFDLSIGDESGESFDAGRNDLFMSIYLPYCHVFVTAEEKAEQEKCLREIVEVAGLNTEVLSYDEFKTRLNL